MQSYYLTGYLSVSSNYPSHLKKIYKIYNDIVYNTDYILGFIDAIGVFKDNCLMLDITHNKELLKYINPKYETINDNLIKFNNSNYLDFIGDLYTKSTEKLYINRLLFNKINIEFIKVDENAIQPFKNNYSDAGYNISIIKQHKIINTNTIMYDTGLQLKIPNGYFAEIIPNQSILKLGYNFTNTIIINSNYNNNIYIYLTKIEENAMNIEFPFNCCQLIIRKQEFGDFIEIS
jgi:dUTPase